MSVVTTAAFGHVERSSFGGDSLVAAFSSVIHFFEVVTIRDGRREVG